MIKNILSECGCQVIGEAENGAAAATKYKQLKPDLMTMDIIMPEMDGIESVKAIYSIDSSANIIMCSAMGQQAIVVEALQAGAKDFVVKPFQKKQIIQAVERVLSRSKMVG